VVFVRTCWFESSRGHKALPKGRAFFILNAE
jgi:hypothetical protein